MEVTLTEAHTRLSHWLKTIAGQPLVITRRGKPMAVLVAPEEYERLRQVQAYLDMLRLSRTLQGAKVTGNELFDASRAELEARP